MPSSPDSTPDSGLEETVEFSTAETQAPEQEVLESESISHGSGTDLFEAMTCSFVADEGDGAQTRPKVHNSGKPGDRSGEIIHERYQLLRQLGAGGMGTVYLAQHTTLPKTFAVKVLNPRFAQREDIAERFLLEAKAVSLIDHENVVGVIDFGTAANGSTFLVMEHLRGESLDKLIKREAPLPWPRVRHIMLQVCRGLAAAHAVDIIHRDIKPENIIRVARHDDADFIKILDFGLAKIQAGGGLRLTRTGMVLGTPEFMSPEQARGRTTDTRTDIYAAGILMYLLLCRELPFKAKSFVEMRNKHMLISPQPPSTRAPEVGITDEMDAIVLRALAKDPDDRFESMAAMARAIEEVGTGKGPVELLESNTAVLNLVEAMREAGDKAPGLGSAGLHQMDGLGEIAASVAELPPAPTASGDRRGARRLWPWLLGALLTVGVGAAVVFAVVLPQTHEHAPSPRERPAPQVAAPADEDPSRVFIRLETSTPAQLLDALDEAIFPQPEPGLVVLPRSDQKLRLLLRAEGYEDLPVEIVPDHDQTLAFELRPAPKAPDTASTAAEERAAEAEAKAKAVPTNKSRPAPKTKVESAPPEPEPPRPEPKARDHDFSPEIVDPWTGKKPG